MKKRLFTCLLAGLLFLSATACANIPDAPPRTDDTIATDDTSVVESAETEQTLNLPERNYDGYAYRILVQEVYLPYIYSVESNGETVNDAVFNANAEVADQFNITFSHIPIDSCMNSTAIQAYILSDEDAYDIALMHDKTTSQSALNGWYHNIYEVPYLDPSNEWWPQFTVDSLTLNGKMYYISNYTTYRALGETRVTFFNRDIITNMNLDNPYELVDNGTWTIDNMAAIANSVYVDVNGSGSQDTEDIMGFVFTGTPYCWLESFGVEGYKKEGKNSAKITLDLNQDITYTLIDKLHDWIGVSGNDSAYVDFTAKREIAMELFGAGKGLFTFKCIGDQLTYLTDSDVNYGIVPFPKVDETQDGYVSACTDMLLSIPITEPDLERTGIIAEAMSYAGYKNILPAYCEIALKNRYSTDEESAAMLDMIFANRFISFAYLHTELQSHLIDNTVYEKNVASWYQTNEPTELENMATITEFYS